MIHVTNMSYDGVPPSTMMGTAAQTASLGDQDMMTYIPPNSQQQQQPQQQQAQGGAQQQQQQQQQANGPMGQQPGGPVAAAAAHAAGGVAVHEGLDVINADIMDLFGDGGNVEGMQLPVGICPPPTAQAQSGQQYHPHSSPVGTSVTFMQQQQQQQQGGKQQPQQQQQQQMTTRKGPATVSDSSCSGRSNASSGISSVTMPAHLSHRAAAAGGGGGGVSQITSNLWGATGMQQQSAAWAAMATATGGGGGGQQAPPVHFAVPAAPTSAGYTISGQQQQAASAAMAVATPMQPGKPIHVMASMPPQQYLQQQQQQQQGAQHQHPHAHQHQHQPMQAPQRGPPTSALPPQQHPTSNKPKSNAAVGQAAARAGTKRSRAHPPAATVSVMGSELGGGDPCAASEDGGGNGNDRAKRRRERNEREQERSHQISAQISHLKAVLTDADVRFKPDKYSTLVSVADYIKSLQRRKSLLDAEHTRLLDTIKKTSDAIGRAEHGERAGGAMAAPAEVVTRNSTSNSASGLSSSPTAATPGGATGCQTDDEELLIFVRGLDYKTIFSSCGIALGIAAVDGRLVDCNDEFVTLSGRTSRDEIVGNPETGAGKKMSLFNILGREGMEDVFGAMSEMLRNPNPPDSAAPAAASNKNESTANVGADHGSSAQSVTSGGGSIIGQRVSCASPPGKGGGVGSDHWSGIVTQGRTKDVKLRLNITLVRSHQDGRPKFFNCALSPEQEQCE